MQKEPSTPKEERPMQEIRNKDNVQITVGQVALVEMVGGYTHMPAWGPRTWGRVLRLDTVEGIAAVVIEDGNGSELVVAADDVTATVDNMDGAALHSGSDPEIELTAAVTAWLKDHQAELEQSLRNSGWRICAGCKGWAAADRIYRWQGRTCCDNCQLAPTNLSELLELLQGHRRWKNSPTDFRSSDPDWSSLPTFGGAPPADPRGVWSWDETHLLVGPRHGTLKLTPRQEVPA